jgi:hypothetical protein
MEPTGLSVATRRDRRYAGGSSPSRQGRVHDAATIHLHLPDLRSDEAGGYAGRQLPVLLRVLGLRFGTPPTGGRVLCVLLVREHPVPTEAARGQRSATAEGIA